MTVVLTLVILPTASARSAPAPLAYRHGLRQVDTQLRLAIESGPEALGEDLHSSESICELAEAAAGRGDAAAAEADWSTLAQYVDAIDARDTAAIDAAFVRADAALRHLRSRFARAWRRQPALVAELRRGVDETSRGVAAMRAAMGRLEGAFAAWRSRRCAGAAAAIESGTRSLAPGLARVNRGMTRLVRLGERRPPRSHARRLRPPAAPAPSPS